MLDKKDLSGVLKVGQIALGCNDLDQLRTEILKLLPDVLHVERAFFFLTRRYPSPRLDLETAVSTGIEQKYMTLFREHYHRVDPVFNNTDNVRTIERVTDVISYGDLMRTEFYKDFLKPQSLRCSIGINLKIGNRLLGVLRLMRSEHEPDFSSDEIVKAELIAPYVTGAVEKATFLDKTRKTEQIISTICRDLPYRGIIVLDESLTPIYVNEEARKTLSQSIDDPEHCENPAVTLPKDLYLQCQKLFQGHPSASRPKEEHWVDLIVNGEKQSVPVNVSLVHDTNNSLLCRIGIGRSAPKSMLPEQSKELGLTRRESEIAGFVCQGLNDGEIGKKLFISEHTVGNHLRAIYEKLEVNNRAAMAHKVTYFTSRR